MANLDQYRVKHNSKFSLNSIKSDDKSERSGDKAKDALELEKLAIKINALQDILNAQSKYKVLLILQGMDASGKDARCAMCLASVIRWVFGWRVLKG